MACRAVALDKAIHALDRIRLRGRKLEAFDATCCCAVIYGLFAGAASRLRRAIDATWG